MLSDPSALHLSSIRQDLERRVRCKLTFKKRRVKVMFAFDSAAHGCKTVRGTIDATACCRIESRRSWQTKHDEYWAPPRRESGYKGGEGRKSSGKSRDYAVNRGVRRMPVFAQDEIGLRPHLISLSEGVGLCLWRKYATCKLGCSHTGLAAEVPLAVKYHTWDPNRTCLVGSLAGPCAGVAVSKARIHARALANSPGKSKKGNAAQPEVSIPFRGRPRFLHTGGRCLEAAESRASRKVSEASSLVNESGNPMTAAFVVKVKHDREITAL